jgi:hypothetical protein
VKCYKKANYDAIYSEIKAIDWSNVTTEQHDINDAWKVKNKITDIEERHVPSRTSKTTFNKKHGFPLDKETNKIHVRMIEKLSLKESNSY